MKLSIAESEVNLKQGDSKQGDSNSVIPIRKINQKYSHHLSALAISNRHFQIIHGKNSE